jgi:hypothetical protein
MTREVLFLDPTSRCNSGHLKLGVKQRVIDTSIIITPRLRSQPGADCPENSAPFLVPTSAV